MKTNVSHAMPAANQPQLLARARPFDGLLPHLEGIGIGYLYKRRTSMEVQYDTSGHSSNFFLTGAAKRQAAQWVRAEMHACGVCAAHASIAPDSVSLDA
jgi:hypothetical protein